MTDVGCKYALTSLSKTMCMYAVHLPTNALFINLVKSFKIYIKIHNNIAPTRFGL